MRGGEEVCNFSGGSGSSCIEIMELIIRRFAGTFILLSLVLAKYHSPNWLWFTAFVGVNLLQSSFTNFCPLEIILRKMGVGQSCCCCSEGKDEKGQSCCGGGEGKDEKGQSCCSK